MSVAISKSDSAWRKSFLPFLIAYAIAVSLHFAVMAAWTGFTSPVAVEKPFRTLKIKLGKAQPILSDSHTLLVSDNDDEYVQPIFPEETLTAQEREGYVSRYIEETRKAVTVKAQKRPAPTHPHALKESPLVAWKAPSVTSARTSAAQLPPLLQRLGAAKGNAAPVATPEAKAPALPAEEGSPLGNSVDQDAQHLENYNRLLSLWFDKHKPQDANQAGQGEFIVTLDREGNILSYDLLQSTGIQSLDSAIVSTIINANPVPRLPRDFEPQTQRFAFKIRMNFSLKR